MWFIGVEVEQETSAPPPKKNPGSAPEISLSLTSSLARPPQLLSFFEVKIIHQSNFQSTSLVRRKKERYLDLRGYVTRKP